MASCALCANGQNHAENNRTLIIALFFVSKSVSDPMMDVLDVLDVLAVLDMLFAAEVLRVRVCARALSIE
jgi:hypothetical protein